jgi:hypothetical protein
MEYTISIETNNDGWLTGQCEQLPQAISQGENLEDLMENMQGIRYPNSKINISNSYLNMTKKDCLY